MLSCKDCDYYRPISEKASGAGFSICEFADMLFLNDVDDLNIEYPCKKINYNEYLQKKSAGRLNAAAGKELINPELFRQLKECGVCMLKFPDGTIESCFQEPAENQSVPAAGPSLKRARVLKR